MTSSPHDFRAPRPLTSRERRVLKSFLTLAVNPNAPADILSVEALASSLHGSFRLRNRHNGVLVGAITVPRAQLPPLRELILYTADVAASEVLRQPDVAVEVLSQERFPAAWHRPPALLIHYWSYGRASSDRRRLRAAGVSLPIEAWAYGTPASVRRVERELARVLGPEARALSAVMAQRWDHAAEKWAFLPMGGGRPLCSVLTDMAFGARITVSKKELEQWFSHPDPQIREIAFYALGFQASKGKR